MAPAAAITGPAAGGLVRLNLSALAGKLAAVVAGVAIDWLLLDHLLRSDIGLPAEAGPVPTAAALLLLRLPLSFVLLAAAEIAALPMLLPRLDLLLGLRLRLRLGLRLRLLLDANSFAALNALLARLLVLLLALLLRLRLIVLVIGVARSAVVLGQRW